MEGETKLCTNCKRDIAAGNFVMHEMHCRRHIVLCDKCNEPIPRSELDQHFNDVHQKVPCELCQKEIAKEDMDDHMEKLCLKKQMRCEYCELSVAKDGLEAHIDYCGSRTECCNLCQQYVMLKDMTQHELSGCTYPEPKPAPPSNQTSVDATQLDPFSMSYLRDFLASDFNRVNSHVPSNTQRQVARNGRDRPSRGGKSSNRARSTQQASRGRQSTRNKSNVNSERQRASDNSVPGSSVDLPPDMDYDTMLALQMAHEDMVNQDGSLSVGRDTGNDGNGLNYHWQHFSDNDFGTEAHTQTDSHLDTEDNDATIPCDACHLEIPFDMYIEHTDYCWQRSEVNDATDPTTVSEPRDRNNAMPITSDSQRTSIPVIDNLHQSHNLHRIQTDDSPIDGEEDICLPCEFCDEVYPSELILQHQVVCPSNATATPRAVTPASGYRSSRRRDKDKDNNQVRAAFGQNNFSSTQTTGLSSFGGDAGMPNNNDDDEDGLRSNFFRDESYKTSLQSASDKYGGSPVSDRASYFAAYNSGRRNSNNRDTEEDDGPPRTYEPARANKSGQRARARLNQLLQDEDVNGSQRSGSRSNNVNNHHRRGAAAAAPASITSRNTTGASSNGRGRKGRMVDARTVIREVTRDLDIARASHNGVSGPSTRPRVNNSTSTTTTTTTPSTSTRNRQRSDHVFSPELRPKPNDSWRR